MDRIAGGVLGLAAMVAVAALSVARGVSLADASLRAGIAAVLGWIVGRLVFGRPGLLGDAETAGKVPSSAAPEAPGGGGPAQTPAGRGPGSKPA